MAGWLGGWVAGWLGGWVAGWLGCWVDCLLSNVILSNVGCGFGIRVFPFHGKNMS